MLKKLLEYKLIKYQSVIDFIFEGIDDELSQGLGAKFVAG